MSGKFSNTGTTLPSQFFRHQDLIREIVQDQILQLMSSIKTQIQSKIKSIDSDILALKNQINKIGKSSPQFQMTVLMQRLKKIETEIQNLRKSQESGLKNTRNRSFDQQRKPIFTKENQTVLDLGGAILRLEDLQNMGSSHKKIFSERKGTQNDPSLSNIQAQTKTKVQEKSRVLVGEIQKKQPKRNPILDSSDSEQIHRWITANNNRETSCFGSIIREQDIEQSIFY